MLTAEGTNKRVHICMFFCSLGAIVSAATEKRRVCACDCVLPPNGAALLIVDLNKLAEAAGVVVVCSLCVSEGLKRKRNRCETSRRLRKGQLRTVNILPVVDIILNSLNLGDRSLKLTTSLSKSKNTSKEFLELFNDGSIATLVLATLEIAISSLIR